MFKSSHMKMSENKLLPSLVAHVTAYAKFQNNISVCTKSDVNPEVATHDLRFVYVVVIHSLQ
jgi:hypothetical protein